MVEERLPDETPPGFLCWKSASKTRRLPDFYVGKAPPIGDASRVFLLEKRLPDEMPSRFFMRPRFYVGKAHPREDASQILMLEKGFPDETPPKFLSSR